MGRSSQPETAYAAWSSPVPLPSAVRTTSKLPEVFVISIEVTSLGSSEVSEMLSLLSSSDTAEEDDLCRRIFREKRCRSQCCHQYDAADDSQRFYA
ncbi:MAG: hypothetical protein ACLUOF_05940 [Ruminococcus sp.]